MLMRNAGRVVARDALIAGVWGWDAEVENNTLDVFVHLLRTKVEAPGGTRLIHTVRGVGYCLREEGQWHVMSIRARLTLVVRSGAVARASRCSARPRGICSSGAWRKASMRVLTQRIEGVRTLLVAEAAEHDNSPQTMREELGEFARSTAEGALLQVRDASGALMLPPNPIFTADDWQPGTRTIDRNAHRYRVRVAAAAPYQLMTATSLDDGEAILGELRSLFLWMLPNDLAAALLGGYWISRRALAPVDQMTRAVKAISVNNLSQRLDSPRTGDELQHLAETWNEVLERLDAAMKRVKQFTADASHELRTPLALIHSTADLALRRERTPETYREALHQIRGGTERMAALTDSLLTLARADAGEIDMPRASVDLSCVVADVVQSSGGARRSARRVSCRER